MDTFLRNGVNIYNSGGKGFSGDAHFFEDIATPAKVRQYLDSVQEGDKLNGMKLLLAMLSKGKDIPEFFPDVVKNVVVNNIEVKKMVYIYLVHYADFDETCREIALLSINSFHKDMSGTNQLIRGLALRVLTSIRVHDIIQIQLLAVRKCSTDNSPYVRKCAANAISKIHMMDPEQDDQLKQILETLLKDDSTMVLGSAMVAFQAVCPTAYELIHPNYRKLCHLLADMDEWSQVPVLEIMTRYTRNQFTNPAPRSSRMKDTSSHQSHGGGGGGAQATMKRRVVKKAFYSDEEDESGEEDVIDRRDAIFTKPELGSVFTGGEADNDGDLDPDHRLVLKSSLPLLKSRNSGVVLAVCTLHYYCGTQNLATLHQVGKALTRILRNRRETQFMVLSTINIMVKERPVMFRPFLSDFFVKSSDPIFCRLLKLEILTGLCYRENIIAILREFQTYLKDTHETFVCRTIRAVGHIAALAAEMDSSVPDACMKGLMHLLLCSKTDVKVDECVVILRQSIQQNPHSQTAAIILRQLVKLLVSSTVLEAQSERRRVASHDETPVLGSASTGSGGMKSLSSISSPTARSSIVWLAGEFQHIVGPQVGPDILRILAGGFADEHTDTKMQILNFAIKQSLHHPEDETVQVLMTYVLEMSRYDTDTDLRDRARFMTALVGLAPSNEDEDGGGGGGQQQQQQLNGVDEDALAELAEHAHKIMLAPKPAPVLLNPALAFVGSGSTHSSSSSSSSYFLGSMSSVVGHSVPGYTPLSDWSTSSPSSSNQKSIRDPVTTATTTAPSSSSPHPVNRQDDAEDLGAFYGNDDPDGGVRLPQKHGTGEVHNSRGGSDTASESGDSGSSSSGSDSDDSSSRSSACSSSSSSGSESDDNDTTSTGSSSSSSSSSRVNHLQRNRVKKSRNLPQGRSPSSATATATTVPAGAASSHRDQYSSILSPDLVTGPSMQQVPAGSSGQQQQQQHPPVQGMRRALGRAKRSSSTATGGGGGSNNSGGDTSNLLIPMMQESPSTTTSPTLKDNNSHRGNNVPNLLDTWEPSSPTANQDYADTSIFESAINHSSSSSSSSMVNKSDGGGTISRSVNFGDDNLLSAVNSGSYGIIRSNPNSIGSNLSTSDGNTVLVSPPGTRSDKVSQILGTFDNNNGNNTNNNNSSGGNDGSSASSSTALMLATGLTGLSMNSSATTTNTGGSSVMMMSSNGGGGGSAGYGNGKGGSLFQYTTAPLPKDGERFANPKEILKPDVGGRLRVSLVRSFQSTTTTAPTAAAAAAVPTNMTMRGYLHFQNVPSPQDQPLPIRRIRIMFPVELRNLPSTPATSGASAGNHIPEVAVLMPGQEVWIPFELSLAGIVASKHVKVDIRSDKGVFVGVLHLQEWDLVQPLLPNTAATMSGMSAAQFEATRARLGGFSEEIRSCSVDSLLFGSPTTAAAPAAATVMPVGTSKNESAFNSVDVETQLLSRVTRALNVAVVQGAGIGELMFVGGVRRRGMSMAFEQKLLLITIVTTSNTITLRLNSEDPVLCTSLAEVFFKLVSA